MKLMHRYGLLFILICCYHLAAAQPGIVKVYAYQRAVVPGTVPKVIAEDGTVKERATSGSYYRYIYIEHKRSVKDIIPLKVWIDQKPYAVSYEEMKGTPVIVPGGDGHKDTVVPATHHAILQVLPGEALLNEPVSGSLKKSISQNKLVILYNCGKKTYHASMRQLKNLPSFILQ